MPIDDFLKQKYEQQFGFFRSRCDKWHGFNQTLKNALFILGVVAGALTLVAGVFFEAQTLKVAVAIFGLISSVVASCQKFMRSGPKAEFYSVLVTRCRSYLRIFLSSRTRTRCETC
jgi:hypothetical protein